MKQSTLIQLDDYRPENTIRTETVLSRFPLHKLTKGGTLSIEIKRQGRNGKLTTAWEVSPNKKYGDPGILAYKLDTLIINRRIEEARKNLKSVPELIKLGSLREIAAEVGAGEKNTTKVKKALLQNALSAITAKLDYKGNDGTERTFEFATTRYTLIFTGEKLPNGKKAEALYIELHPRFRELLNHATTRPLDYDYLKQLPPAAQRLYELISYAVFGALNRGNERAKYSYSDFCTYGPLTRFSEWDQVRPQMYRIHKPHIEAKYISKVEFEETTDEEGRPDWIMWYTPGAKAKAEHKAFTKKGEITETDGPRELKRITSLFPPLQTTAEDTAAEDLINELSRLGVGETTARQLVRTKRAEVVRQLEAWPHRDKTGMKNPPGILVKFIREAERIPAALLEIKQKAEKTKQEQAKREHQEAQKKARQSHEDAHREAFEKYLSFELSKLEKSNQEAYAAFERDFDKRFGRTIRTFSAERRADIRLSQWAEYIAQRSELGILTFWQWDREKNPHPFEESSR